MIKRDMRVISANRSVLENVYAFNEDLEEDYERGEATKTSTRRKRSVRFRTFAEIEKLATELQRKIWDRRSEFGLDSDCSPIEVLESELAAKLLGYQHSVQPSLGWIAQGRNRIAVAGMINHADRIISIASDVEPRVRRFTAAHEIGHVVLHPQLEGLHRDRPTTGIGTRRDRIEIEADKFATFFLMPRRLLISEFNRRFLQPFALENDTSFALLGKPLAAAERILPTVRHISRELAAAISYNGRHFDSLANHFGVSIEAMAIRLEELELVAGR